MRCLSLLLLLIISTGNLVECQELRKIEFPVKLLGPDLEAIEKYHSNYDDHLDAYVRWPKEILFRFQRIVEEGEVYLRIDGMFKVKLTMAKSSSYDGLYYKENNFYGMKERNENRKMEMIPLNALARYTQPSWNSCSVDRTYLSIRYFSMNDLKEIMNPFFVDNKAHMRTAVDSSPATFLAVAPKPEAHFVEYTLLSEMKRTPEADGYLQVLIGDVINKTVTLTKNIEARKLVLNQYLRLLYVRTESREMEEEVFGVRMASVGFLAEWRSSKVRMLSNRDLMPGAPDPSRHLIYAKELVEKVKKIEPKFSYLDVNVDIEGRPKKVQFQVMGHVLVKSPNIKKWIRTKSTSVRHLPGLDLDPACPLVIEYETKGTHFLVANRVVDKICTDDSTMWVERVNGAPVPLVDEVIVLMYPETNQ